jgi:hypothetical protein
MPYSRVFQPGFRGTLGFLEMSLGVPREIVIEKNKHRFLNLLAKINRSAEKYHKKVVPLHAMEALGGRGGIAPTHSRPRH